MNEPQERLKKLFEDSGMSYSELAEITKIPKSALQRYVSGTTGKVPMDRMSAIARALGGDPAQIMGWDVSTAEQIGIEPYRPTKFMPVLGRVAAGLPMCADENVEGYVANDYRDEYDYFALRVRGDSMDAAGVDDGDIVVVRQQDVVEDGDMAVVLVNGYDATVKYWHKEGRMVMLSPKSHNPDHKLQVYDCKDVPIKVLGRVVQIRKEV